MRESIPDDSISNLFRELAPACELCQQPFGHDIAPGSGDRFLQSCLVDVLEVFAVLLEGHEIIKLHGILDDIVMTGPGWWWSIASIVWTIIITIVATS